MASNVIFNFVGEHVAMIGKLAAAVVAVLSSASFATVVAGPIVRPTNGHAYYLLSQDTWANSEAAAIGLGGHLVTINDAAEQAFVFQLGQFGGVQRLIWTGLNDATTEGQFKWTSGDPVTYTNWAAGEPNSSSGGEDYAALYYPGHSAAGQWNDWDDRSSDPIGLPFNGVVEVVPEPSAAAALVGSLLALRRRKSSRI